MGQDLALSLFDSSPFLTEISKKQREILEAMNIEEKDLVIN